MLGLMVDVGLNGTRYYTKALNAAGVKYLTASIPTRAMIYELKIGNLNAARRLVSAAASQLKERGCDSLAIACMTLQGMASTTAENLGMKYDSPIQRIASWISSNRPGVIGSSLFIDRYCQGYCQLPNGIQADIDKAIWSAALGVPISYRPFDKAAYFFASTGVREVLVGCTDLVDVCKEVEWHAPVRSLPEIHVNMLVEQNRY